MSQSKKFQLVMQLFEMYARILVEHSWMEIRVFEIPLIPLSIQDQKDLAYVISSKVPAMVEFNRTDRKTILVSIKRI